MKGPQSIRRLSVIDLAFFILETAERPMNVGPLMVLAPPTTRRGGRSFVDVLHDRMLRRPVGAPFSLRLTEPSLTALPRLVPDPTFDLARHVHRSTLPKPGTIAALTDRVCELHQQRLDRSRPLWEFHLIDGLKDGRFALYAKMHHGIVDGPGFARIVTQWLSTSPSDKLVRAFWEGSGRGTELQRANALTAHPVSKLLEVGSGGIRTAISFGQLLGRQAIASFGLGMGASLPFIATSQVLKAAPSTQRSFAFCTLPFARLKALGKTRGATVNDMLLAVLGIALRRYLERIGTATATPLVADIAVALGADGSGGNHIAMVQVPLGPPELDPASRLDFIRTQTRSMKDHLRDGFGNAAMLHSIVFHGLLSLWEGIGWRSAPLLANLVVASPRGSSEKRYLMGAEVEFALPLSAIAPGQVLNVTGINYGDRYEIAFLALANAVPNISRLAKDAAESFEALAASLSR